MDGSMFDGLGRFIVGVAIVVGIVCCGVGFGIAKLLQHLSVHFSLGWH